MSSPSAYAQRMATILEAAGLKDAAHEVDRFLIDNPGMDQEITPEQAADEYLAGAAPVDTPESVYYYPH